MHGSFTSDVSRLMPSLVVGAALALAGLFVSPSAMAQRQRKSPRQRAPESVVPAQQNVIAPSVAFDILRVPSADETQSLEKVREEDLRLFVRRMQDFLDVAEGTIWREYETRQGYINSSYRRQIELEEEQSNETRRTAIEYFEAFLTKHPDSPPYTADAMFRLAELYYDESYITYLDAQMAFSDALERGETEGLKLPTKDFDRTIDILRKLAKRYPEYQNIDGAYYVLGYCLNETAREEEARLAWLSSVCANRYKYDPRALSQKQASRKSSVEVRPAEDLETGERGLGVGRFQDPFANCEPISDNSRFYFESWWLIGNYHFDFDTSRYGVETSISAYQKLTVDPEHKFYDKGLYKLAWSYFKADRYPEAIDAFSKVVEFADANKETAGTGMRPEAIQYLAVCFFTEDWDLDLVPDEVTPLQRIKSKKMMPQNRPWSRDVYDRLGDIFSDNERNEQAIEIWQVFLKRWPLDVNAPFVQEKIAIAYNKMRRFDDEIVERGRLEAYGPGSEWWHANADQPLKQAEVSDMSRDALLESAYYHHENAQKLKQHGLAAQDAELLQAALTEYHRAAGAYRKFVENNPDTPDSYEINFYLADALFWSGQYALAKEEYIKVRDSNLDDKHRAEAAESVIYCLEKTMEQQLAAGELVMREEPPSLEGEPLVPRKMPLPGIVMELMKEREQFIDSAPEHKNAAIYKYQSAQNYFRYGYWDQAKTRYSELYETYCHSDAVGIVAWKTLLNMATLADDIDEKERLALVQKDKQCKVEGIDETDEGIPLDELLGDVAMQRSLKKFGECMETNKDDVCTEAGKALVEAVGKAPSHPSADAALHNAALAYETAQRFETAMRIYGQIVAEYPQSQWVDKCLFKQAFAASSFFEYQKALDNYRILADENRFGDSQYRVDAIFNSAFILTNLQSYKDASSYWTRYSNEVTDDIKRIEARFNAADMFFKARRWNQAIKAYEGFISRHRGNTDAGPFVVKASYRIGQAYQKKRSRLRYVFANWADTIRHYDELVNDPGSISAEYAAQYNFNQIETDMRKFEKFSIKGSMNKIERLIQEGAEKVQEFEARYREIQEYRRPQWSLAAEFRIGYAYEVYAKALLNIPPPPLDTETQKLLGQLPAEDRELVMIEYEEKFKGAMEQYVAGAEEKAQAEYKVAIELARKGNISNKWTLLALERMNAYDPDSYPRQHNGDVQVLDDTIQVPTWAPEVQQ